MDCIQEVDSVRKKKDLKLSESGFYRTLHSKVTNADIFLDWLISRILDVTKAYDEAVVAQAEQSSQIVNLMSQVRDLRAARDEAEADRAALVTAKKSLEQRLEEIGTEYLSANSGE